MGATAGAIRAGRAFVELFADDSKMQAVLKRSQVRLLSFSDFIRTIGLRMSALGTVLTVPFVKATDTYSKFSDAMLVVKAVTSATEKDFAVLTTTARTLGKTTSFAAISVADLMGELGRAGFTARQVDVMTASVLNLARASNTEAPLAAKILASTLRQFEKDATEAAAVTNLLAKTANASATSVDSIGQSLEYAGAVSHQMGMSLERTLAIIGTLGNVGILGTEAGTAIRRLATMTSAQADEMRAVFGVAFKDARGNALPLVDVLERINQATANLGSADRMKKYHDAFSILGITSAIAVGRAAGSVRELEKELQNVGDYAAQAARKMDSEIGGALRFARSAFADIGLSIGKALESDVVPIVKQITLMFRNLSAFIQENPKEIVQIAKSAVGIAAVGTALMGLGVAGGIAALNLRGIGYALHFALTPARLLSDTLGGVLSIAYRAEKLGTSWAGMLMSNVIGGGRSRWGRRAKSIAAAIDKSPVYSMLYPKEGAVGKVLKRLTNPGRMGMDVATTATSMMNAPMVLARGGFKVARGVGRMGRRSVYAGALALLGSGDLDYARQMKRGKVDAAGGLVRIAKGAGLAARALGGLIRLPLASLAIGFPALVSGVGLLLNPMTLLAGAGIAVVANWDRIKGAITGVVSTAPGALSSMWGRIKSDALPTLLGIRDTALTAFGGISEAIQAGDIPAAMGILWSGIKAIWAEGFGYLRMKWFDLTTWAGDAFNAVLQVAIGAALGIANVFDMALFDWFSIRLTDVTSAFAASWDWIKQAGGATATWIQEKWNSAFGGVGASAVSIGDTIFFLMEMIRKKMAQVMAIEMKMLSLASQAANIGTFGLAKKFGLKFDFDLGDAFDSINKGFEKRADDRTELKWKIANESDADVKARAETAKQLIDELEAKRKLNAANAGADREKINKDLEAKLALEKKNLATVIQETQAKRQQREDADRAARRQDSDQPPAHTKPTGPVMPEGLTRQQQRSWQIKEQIRQRNEFFAAKKAASEAKKKKPAAAFQIDKEFFAQMDKQRQAHEAEKRRRDREAAGIGPDFINEEAEKKHDVTMRDAWDVKSGKDIGKQIADRKAQLRKEIQEAEKARDWDKAERARKELGAVLRGEKPAFDLNEARLDLKNRIPDLQALRLPSVNGPAKGIVGSHQPVKVDQTQVVAKIDRTNGHMVALIDAVRNLKPVFGV